MSLDGDSPYKNRKRISKNGGDITGQVIANINYLKKSKKNFAIRMTVEPDNVGDLFDSINGFVKMGYNRIFHALNLWSNKWTEEKFEEYYRQLKKIHMEYGLRTELIISGAQIHNIVEKGKCSGGVNDITIYADGNLYPCTAVAGNKNYCIGNVKDGVKEHWMEKLEYINNTEIEECIGCSLIKDCMADKCRFVNKAITGEYNKACDCICWMENTLYRVRKDYMIKTH